MSEERIVTGMSPHFRRRFKERRGAVPSIAGLNRIIAEGTQIREQRVLWDLQPDGRFKKIRQLDEYWNNRVGVIVLVDRYRKRAVTVLTDKEGIKGRRPCRI